MVDLFANSLGNLSIKGTANVVGAATFNDNVSVASGKNITVNSAITLNPNGLVTATSYSGNGAGLTGVDPFEANTSMIFNQASAPTGWTKQTGTGGGTGGGDSFYSTFGTGRNADSSGATVSVTGTVGGHTLSTPELSSHTHPGPKSATPGGGGTGLAQNASNPGPNPTGSTGGGGSHTHPFSVDSSSLGGTISMPAMNVKYANVIVANKD